VLHSARSSVNTPAPSLPSSCFCRSFEQDRSFLPSDSPAQRGGGRGKRAGAFCVKSAKNPPRYNKEIAQHKNHETESQHQENSAQKKPSKTARQSKAREIVASKSLEACCRTPIAGRTVVNVVRNGDKLSYGGLMSCGSVWQCPVCASKITEKRRTELKIAEDVWKLNGGQVVMETLTVPHYLSDNLEELLKKIGDAFRHFTNNRTWKKLASAYGILHRIRCLEVTYGYHKKGNGWHPHFHVLFFLKDTLEEQDLRFLQSDHLALWQFACISVGLPEPNKAHGLTISSPEDASKYVSKWGMVEEMTKGHLKQGKTDGLAPFALLDECILGDTKAGELFRDYAKAFKGKRQLVWSKGLREAVGLGGEESDAEVAAKEEPGEIVAQITHHVWVTVVLKHELRESLLETINKGGVSAGEMLLSKFLEKPPNIRP